MPASQSGFGSACMGQLKCIVTSNAPNCKVCTGGGAPTLQSLPQTACIEPLSAALPCWNSTLASTYQGQKPSEGMTGWESMKPFTRFGGTFICWARPAHSGPSSWLSAAVAGAAAMASTAKGTGAEVDQAGWMDGRSGGSRLRKALAGTGGGGKRGTSAAASEVIHTLAGPLCMKRAASSGWRCVCRLQGLCEVRQLGLWGLTRCCNQSVHLGACHGDAMQPRHRRAGPLERRHPLPGVCAAPAASQLMQQMVLRRPAAV